MKIFTIIWLALMLIVTYAVYNAHGFGGEVFMTIFGYVVLWLIVFCF